MTGSRLKSLAVRWLWTALPEVSNPKLLGRHAPLLFLVIATIATYSSDSSGGLNKLYIIYQNETSHENSHYTLTR